MGEMNKQYLVFYFVYNRHKERLRRERYFNNLSNLVRWLDEKNIQEFEIYNRLQPIKDAI